MPQFLDVTEELAPNFALCCFCCPLLRLLNFITGVRLDASRLRCILLAWAPSRRHAVAACSTGCANAAIERHSVLMYIEHALNEVCVSRTKAGRASDLSLSRALCPLLIAPRLPCLCDSAARGGVCRTAMELSVHRRVQPCSGIAFVKAR